MEIKKVGVVGGGTMGNGIAHVFAQSGYDVVLVEQSGDLLEKALSIITKNLGRLVKKEKITQEEADAALAKIKKSTDLDDVKDCQLVVEAVFESFEVKKEIFEKLDKVGDRTIR
jgi:3-hydroxybutyryl-CoA dehydrogenase